MENLWNQIRERVNMIPNGDMFTGEEFKESLLAIISLAESEILHKTNLLHNTTRILNMMKNTKD